MKNSQVFVAAAAAALARTTAAHYIFSKLVLNGVATNDWEYIRQTTRAENYMPTKFSNTFDNLTPNDADFRCNLGSFGSAANTGVADVTAGDTIGMKLFYDGSIAHPGPGQVFMSKAPSGNVQEYEGDGEWFKIWESTLCDEAGDLTQDAWCTYGMSEFDFAIPADLPDGEYLVRAEHVGLHGAQDDEAEFFYSCAQVSVTGGGSGTPAVTYQIPGLYTEDMTLFNGGNLWVDSADTVQANIDSTPVGDDVSFSGSSSSSSSGSAAAPVSSTTPVAEAPAASSTPAFGGWPAAPSGVPAWNPWSAASAKFSRCKH